MTSTTQNALPFAPFLPFNEDTVTEVVFTDVDNDTLRVRPISDAAESSNRVSIRITEFDSTAEVWLTTGQATGLAQQILKAALAAESVNELNGDPCNPDEVRNFTIERKS